MLDLEGVIRDDCATEFEQRLALELARFKASLAQEQERNEEHWDRKVDVLERGLDAGGDEDEGDKENVLIENLAEEVERLRRENGVLKRELTSRSPSKRKPLEEREDFSPASPSGRPEGIASLGRKLEKLRVSSDSVRMSTGSNNGSPKKARKIAGKRWEGAEELQ